MKNIIFAVIKEEWAKGRIVAAEIFVFSDQMKRAIVHDIATKSRVKTAYGISSPHCIYSFANFAEAQKWVDEI